MRRTCAPRVTTRPTARPAPRIVLRAPRRIHLPSIGRQVLSASSQWIPRAPRRGYTDIVTTNGKDITPPSSGPNRSLGHLASEVQIESSVRGLNIFPYRVLGHETQIVEIDLLPENVIRAEVGSLLYMTQGVEMETKHGDLSQGMKRMLSGESFFITDFKNTNTEGVAKVAFGGNYPCKVLPMRLDHNNGELICQKGAFLAGASNTAIELFFTQKLSTGFFGGEGFILQRLVGDGLVLLKGGGATIIRELQAGEMLRVATGSIIAFQSSVNYDVQMIKGAKNIIFGGEGLFFTQLTGPGTVWLQGLPFDRVVDSILSKLQPGGGYGGLLGTAAVLHGLGGLGGGAAGAAAGAAGGAAGGVAGATADAATGSAAGDAGAGAIKDDEQAKEEKDDEEDDGDDDDDGNGGKGWGGVLGSLFG